MKASNTPTVSPTRSRSTRSSQVVTLDMVARMAGVSPSTVSRILNGTAVVSATKKAAIEDAIAKLRFVPNPVARGLAGGRTFSIGVITGAIDSPYYGITMRGIEEQLDPAGYSPLFVSGHWNVKSEKRCIDTLLSRRVDGIIVLTGLTSDAELKACAKKVPVVVTGRRLKAVGLFSLDFDNAEGARLATQHLIDLGHRRIAMINGNLKHPDAMDRFQGYQKALADANIDIEKDLVCGGDFTEASGLAAVAQLLDSGEKFTAIFAANDQMAQGATLGLHRRGVHVPNDVSIIGFDDLLAATFTSPPLSSIHVPAYEQGRLAGTAMLQLIEGIEPASMLPKPRLIQRESSSACTAS